MNAPLRVDFLIDGLIREPDLPVHLDALLLSAATGGRWVDDPPDLPLERESGSGLYRASVLQIRYLRRHSMPLRHLFEADAYIEAFRRGAYEKRPPDKWTPGTGRFKGYDMRVPCLFVTTLSAWCVGDLKGVGDLVSRIRRIGAERRLGLGVVRKCRVVEDPSAQSRSMFRALPDEGGSPPDPDQPWIRGHFAVSPPYWDRSRARPAWLPGGWLVRTWPKLPQGSGEGSTEKGGEQ